jgi:tRNA-5-methyluridine54 2-sulfurtransferase
MECKCGQVAISERGLCEEHFTQWLESKVLQTVDEYNMIKPGEKVLVAASGGKDSLTVLNILAKKYEVTALCVDEGIAGYREKTIADLEKFCAARNIPLIIKSFKEEKGHTLDELNPAHPCTNCGIYRRDIMASTAKGFDVIATGHNLDDEAQVVLMNLFKNHKMKPQPVLDGNDHFTRRVKPLYLIPEADIRRYAYIHELVSEFTECRNAGVSHRRAVQTFLDRQEAQRPGSKEKLLYNYLRTVHAQNTTLQVS